MKGGGLRFNPSSSDNPVNGRLPQSEMIFHLLLPIIIMIMITNIIIIMITNIIINIIIIIMITNIIIMMTR